jgi:hypothetical protein
MKKTLVLLACLLALAFSASAQNQISFANLPLVSAPTPMPSGYFGLNCPTKAPTYLTTK